MKTITILGKQYKIIPMNHAEVELNKEPPIGIIPQWLVNEKRIVELKGAITRYCGSFFEIPDEWITEYNYLVKYIRGKNGFV